jgi:hypothetical protein
VHRSDERHHDDRFDNRFGVDGDGNGPAPAGPNR